MKQRHNDKTCDDDIESARRYQDTFVKRERKLHDTIHTRLRNENSHLAQELEAAESREARLIDNIRKIPLPSDTKFCRDCGVEVEDGKHYRYEKCREVSCAYPIRRYLLTFTPQLRCADCNNKYGATICVQHSSLGPQKMNKFYSRNCMICEESDLAKLVAVPCGMSSYVLLFKDLLLTLSVLEKGTLLVKNAC